MYAKEFSKRLEGKIDMTLDSIQSLQGKLNRATGERTPCPKLVWIIPQQRLKKGLKDRFKDFFNQETSVYFVCEKTNGIGHDEPMIMNFGRQSVKHLLPLVKLSLVTLKVAGVAMSGLPFPIPDVGGSERWEYFEQLFSSAAKDETMSETLTDIEEWLQDIVDRGHSDMGPDRVSRLKRLVGSSYDMFNQKTLKEENAAKWRNSMVSQIAYDDNGEKCKIKWVRI